MNSRVWFVTGASRGLGAEIAKTILAAGNSLIATARKIEALDYLGAPNTLLKLALDVTDEVQVNQAVGKALERFGRIDVLVNNAGCSLFGAVEESSAQEVEGLYRTNIFGMLNLIRAVLPGMRARHSGHVMNISSVGDYAGYQGLGIYGSTKFAVEGITEAMYAELKPLGIHATVVDPEFFRTYFLDPSSLIETRNRISDYAETVGQMREFAGGHNGQQPVDPATLTQALLTLANLDQPPLRFPLGSDTLARIAGKNAYVKKQTEQDDGLGAFLDVRRRLFGIAYRMLGSVAEAEDLVQDVWMRWQTTDRSAVRDAPAYLATTTTRLALNVVQSARLRREEYVGIWLPEPVDTSFDPGLGVERGEALEIAVLLLLERLAPTERAAYILRQAFDYPYNQIGEILMVSEANARQLISRARKHIAVGRRRRRVDVKGQRRLLDKFIAAAQKGELEALEALLASDVISLSDG